MMGNRLGPEKDWEEPEVKQYFRNKDTGDLAYLVFKEGKPFIKLDRPYDMSTVPYREGEWQPELHAEPLGKAQAASIAFEADRALCGFLGIHGERKKEWRNLIHRERVDFVHHGPKGPTPRPEVYRAVMEALKPFTRPE